MKAEGTSYNKMFITGNYGVNGDAIIKFIAIYLNGKVPHEG